jgi:hypothetical protein
LFELIAKQSFDDRPSTISTAIVQINLENANIHRPIFTPDNQTFYISETGLRKLVERKKIERKVAADNWSLRKLVATKISHYEN